MEIVANVYQDEIRLDLTGLEKNSMCRVRLIYERKSLLLEGEGSPPFSQDGMKLKGFRPVWGTYKGLEVLEKILDENGNEIHFSMLMPLDFAERV